MFIKTEKTAGSSLEIALSTYCTGGDVLGPIDSTRRRCAGPSGLGAQNYHASRCAWPQAERARAPAAARQAAGARSTSITRRAICGASSARRRGGSYFKFTDRAQSVRPLHQPLLSYEVGEERTARREPWDGETLRPVPSLSRRIRSTRTGRSTPQPDEMLVDFVARYERLEADLAAMSERLGLDHNIYDDDEGRSAPRADVRPKDADVGAVLEPKRAGVSSPRCAARRSSSSATTAPTRADQAPARR